MSSKIDLTHRQSNRNEGEVRANRPGEQRDILNGNQRDMRPCFSKMRLALATQAGIHQDTGGAHLCQIVLGISAVVMEERDGRNERNHQPRQ
jgi:hypothetical protein